MASKTTSGPTAKKAAPLKRQTVGESIIEGLKEAIAGKRRKQRRSRDIGPAANQCVIE